MCWLCQVSVGRLGIIVNLTFTIVQQKPVQRELQTISFPTFLQQLTATQQAYLAAIQVSSPKTPERCKSGSLPHFVKCQVLL